MPPGMPTPCARCSRPLRPEFRFCPECAYPRTDEGVLSTQIQEVRTRVSEKSGPSMGRFVAPGIWILIAGVVGTAGWFLFDPQAAAHVLEPMPVLTDGVAGVATRRTPPRRVIEPEWVDIPAAAFTAGPPNDDFYVRIPSYSIARHETTNEAWLQFLLDQEDTLRADETWAEAFPGEKFGWSLDEAGHPVLDPAHRSLPVRNISGAAAMLYANWMTRQLDIPGVRIRLPHEGEWEFAARGRDLANLARVFPWGNEFWAAPQPGTGLTPRSPRIGIDANSPTSVDAVIDDSSPFLVVGMGSNVSEWVLQAAREAIGNADDLDLAPELRGKDDRRTKEIENATVFRYVIPSLEGGFIPRVMNIRGASFRHAVSEQKPLELTQLEIDDLDLRGVVGAEREFYTMNPVRVVLHEKEGRRILEERAAALGVQLETIADDLGRAEATLPTRDRLAPVPAEFAPIEALIAELRQQRLDVLFLRARARERLMDWRGAEKDYNEWLELSGAQLEMPDDDEMTRLVRESRLRNRDDAGTRRRALVWEQRSVDASQRFVSTGFRLVRFSIPTR